MLRQALSAFKGIKINPFTLSKGMKYLPMF